METSESANGNVVDARRQLYARLYVQVLQAINSYWMSRLHPADFHILMFVVERTLRWSKDSEAIPYSHFLNGVWSEDTLIQGRVPCSRATLFRSIERLEAAGMIARVRTYSPSAGYGVNRIEINFKLIMAKDDSMVKKPKKPRKTVASVGLKVSKKRGTPLSQGETTLVSTVYLPLSQRCTTNIQNNKTHKDKSHKRSPPSGREAVLSEILEKAKAKTDAAKAKRAGALDKGVTYKSLTTLWQTIMLRTYPRVPVIALSVSDLAIFKNSMKANLSGVDIREFFEWLIASWPTLRSGELSWLNKKYEVMKVSPDFSVMARRLKAFAKAYRDYLMEGELNEKRKEDQRSATEEELAKARAIIAAQARENRELRKLAQRTRVRVPVDEQVSNVVPLRPAIATLPEDLEDDLPSKDW